MSTGRSGDLGEIGRGLREWFAALDVRDNPLYLVLRRSGRPTEGVWGRVFAVGSYAVVFLLLLGAAHWLAQRWFPISYPTMRVLALVIALLGVYLLWAGSGLFQVAMSTLSLLSTPGSIRYGRVQLDEAMLGSRLQDREIVAALVAVMLPRIWLRWFLGPVAAVTLWGLYQLSLQQYEQGMELSFVPMVFELSTALSWLPVSMLMLYLPGVLASIVLLLWLIALGRSGRATWQLGLIAGVVSCAHIVWLPLALARVDHWRTKVALIPQLVDIGAPLLSILLPLAFLTVTLYFSRKRPWLRQTIAWLGTTLGLALLLLWVPQYSLQGDPRLLIADSAVWFGELVWVFSGFALVNPLALALPQSLGLPAELDGFYKSFSVPRYLALLLLQLGYIAICAHAARLAIADWRASEE